MHSTPQAPGTISSDPSFRSAAGGRVLLEKARAVATPEALASEQGSDSVLRDATVLIEGGRIVAIEQGDRAQQLVAQCEQAQFPLRRIDARQHVVIPGLVNTHHHMYQTLTRAVPAAQNAELFDWLGALYPIWQGLTPDMVRVSTQLAMAELLLSGCTTSSDHLYIYPNGVRLEDQVEAAHSLGMRFHACRGAMSVGRSQGGLPPDSLVEPEAAILDDMQRVIERWHDPAPGAMLRVALAPCSPFSVSQELMRQSALLARAKGVRLHTHLAENDKDIAYTRERFNCTPSEYAEQLGWLGPDVWHAHCVKLDERNDPSGLRRFARTGTGVAHCPCSNMRLASGIAPVPQMLSMGVPVGLGVDGSASNDGGSMLGEVRQAMLLARVGHGPAALSARQALQLGSAGGARVLGRNDIGAIVVGMQADLALFRLDDIGFAGALHDEIAALVFCHAPRADYTLVQGRVVVDQGQVSGLDLAQLIDRHNHLSRQLLERAA